MKVKIDRDVLADAVTWTARTLPMRPAIPVLAGVKLCASGQTVQISSFDYEVSARCEVPAEVDNEGEVLVSGRLLADITKALPAKPVELSLDGMKVDISCGSAHFSLMTMPVDDYPVLPAIPALAGRIDAQEFSRAVSQVTIAASKDEALPLLTGVRVEIEGENLTLLATDRYRLAVREMKWHPADPNIQLGALIKAKTLSDVAKSMTSAGPVEINLEEPGSGISLVGFQAGGRLFTSQLIDGEYPAVRKLFPEQTLIHAVIDRHELMGAVKRVALVTERDTAIRLNISTEGLRIEAAQGEDAAAFEEISVTLSGEDITAAFNPQYLSEALATVGTKYVRMSFTHPSKPAILTGQEEIDGDQKLDFRYLLMPIRYGA